MLDFFREGGWGMWGVLVFGLIGLGSAIRYAWDLEPTRIRFVAVMLVTLVCASLHAMLTDVAQVFWYLQSPERVPDAELTRTLITGLMESTRPGGLAGIFLVLALCVLAVGVHRDGARQLRAS